MYLPIRPRRTHLQVFGVTMVLGTGLLAGMIAEQIAAGWFLQISAMGVILAGIVSMRPTVMSRAYEVWRSFAELYMRVARWTLKAVCFFILFVIVGRGGSTLPLGFQAGGIQWGERKSLSRDEFLLEFEGTAHSVPAGKWFSAYVQWAKRSGNTWVLMLVPFLVLLAYFDEDVQADIPQNIYTLF